MHAEFIKKADKLKPKLNEKIVEAQSIVLFAINKNQPMEVCVKEKKKIVDPLYLKRKGDVYYIDFEEHSVGYFRMTLATLTSPQDAPLKLRLTFGETPYDVVWGSEDYKGWLSDTWIQEEDVFIDETPKEFCLERRHSFRYVKIEVLGISRKNQFKIENIQLKQVSSAPLIPLKTVFSGIAGEMDIVAKRTLRDCMQDVFEDGPKRDQRLWIGDLRLQALVNYCSYNNTDLVKRCLYLLAGTTKEGGRIPSCLFIKPTVHADDIYLFDYYMLFIPTLLEYYEATQDRETLEELWPIAYQQIDHGKKVLMENKVKDDPDWWVFIDWNDDLNKQVAAQGVFIYCLNYAEKIATILEAGEEKIAIVELKNTLIQSARTFYEPQMGLFRSGKNNQISWASQVWMILSGVASQDEAMHIMDYALYDPRFILINTPYLMHYYVEALYKVGRNKEAEKAIEAFWGEMVKDGADTFWEVYNPNDKNYSPYGHPVVNSYCHAWSCSPTYFLAKKSP